MKTNEEYRRLEQEIELLKARAEWIYDQHWFQERAEFELLIPEAQTSKDF